MENIEALLSFYKFECEMRLKVQVEMVAKASDSADELDDEFNASISAPGNYLKAKGSSIQEALKALDAICEKFLLDSVG